MPDPQWLVDWHLRLAAVGLLLVTGGALAWIHVELFDLLDDAYADGLRDALLAHWHRLLLQMAGFFVLLLLWMYIGVGLAS